MTRLPSMTASDVIKILKKAGFVFDGFSAVIITLRRLQVEIGAELDALMPAVPDRVFKGEL